MLTLCLGCVLDAAAVKAARCALGDDGATVLASDESPVRGSCAVRAHRRGGPCPRRNRPRASARTPPKPKSPSVPAGLSRRRRSRHPVRPKHPAPSRATIESSSLKGIEPGGSTVADLKREWGEPKETSATDDGTRFVYELPGFKRVEVFTANDRVGYMLLQFARSFPSEEVAKQLKFEGVEPVTIHDEQGKPLGLAYPERGVVLSFDDAAQVEPRFANPAGRRDGRVVRAARGSAVARETFRQPRGLRLCDRKKPAKPSGLVAEGPNPDRGEPICRSRHGGEGSVETGADEPCLSADARRDPFPFGRT